jgi:hypothetical protein
MKNYAAIALVACFVFVTLASTPSHAQILLRADVPFEFSAGQGMLPAGEYAVTQSGIQAAVTLSSRRRGVQIMLPKTIEFLDHQDATKLVFHRYGDQYFLAEIWSGLDGSVRKLNVNPQERQLAKAGISPEVAVVYGRKTTSGN